MLASRDDTGRVTIAGDTEHPANFGRLCSKGAALGDTVAHDGRLLYPEIRGQRVEWDAALDHVARAFQGVVNRHGTDAVAFYVSGQLLTEDYYVANKLMKGYIGAANIDTNSRLCMSSAVAGHKRAFGADTVPGCYEDLERAKLIVLTGSNTAWCHPVLFQRIRKAKQDNPDLMVVVIDPRRTSTCDIADMHLAIRPGADAWLFNGLLAYLDTHGEHNDLFVSQATDGLDAALDAARASAGAPDTVADKCGLELAQVEAFFRLFARTERVVTVFSQGVNQTSSGVDKINAIINCHLLTGRIGRAGMGPFSFTGQPNAMGGREVGGLANQLAAHMDIEDPAARDRVQRFWQSPVIAAKPGLKAVDLFQAIGDGHVKAVWIMATNPAVSLPDASRMRDAMQRCELVVISESEAATDSTHFAHVRLPAQTWGEKDGMVTNSERCMSRQRTFLAAPGEAKPDWWIVTQVAHRMGFAAGFPYQSPADIFREHAALSAFENNGARDFDLGAVAHLSDNDYLNWTPRQWPLNAAHPGGRKRMFGDGRFYTANARARFIAVTPRQPANPVDKDYPLALNTGRVRDHWHTLTRTGRSARLSGHISEPYLEVHPRDAATYGLRDGWLARVTTRWGNGVLRVRVSDTQRPGALFAPMHWNAQYASLASINSLVNPATDPISGQPEFKHTPARVEPVRAAWYGFLLSRRRLTLTNASYWAVARGDGLWRYEIAGEQAPKDWASCARSLLCAPDEKVEWMEYFDSAETRYRGVRLTGGRIESCIFIGPEPDLPGRDWLQSLFAAERLDPLTRRNLLAGVPPRGQQDTGRIVCACFSVGRNTLVEAIRTHGLATHEAIGVRLKAGTNCGSCIPELKALIAETSAGRATE